MTCIGIVSLVGALAFSISLNGQPVIDKGALNAASYLEAAAPNGGIAQGAMFVVFGEGIGPE